MDKNSIIRSLKGLDDEKVGFSLKLPVSLKNELQELCEKENISMNGLIVATVQSFINDDCGKQTKEMKKVLLQCRGIVSDCYDSIESQIEKNGYPDEYHYKKLDEYASALKSINNILGA